MLFSGMTFLFAFLPIVLAVYFCVPFKAKNTVLLISSFVFYFCGEPIYSLLMLGSCLSGWLHGLWIEKWRGTARAKIPLISSIIISIGALAFFKYSDFAITNINALFRSDIALLRLALPIGISFYTFQILSYTIDVYHGNAGVQRSFVNFATYVALFPQLIAGPIVRYTTVESELMQRSVSFEGFALGARRFVLGLAKKVIIANSLAELCSAFADSSEKTVLFFWVNAIAYMLQIYFDFSGYSDMAIGLGRILGFSFPENFDHPFVSRSITEFWRRWHMTLGSWFRDYLYIPLGGNRKGVGRWLLNIAIVWMLTGLWHGAEWNFVAWGVYFAVLLIIEKLFLGKLLGKLPKFVGIIYQLFTVAISFVIFGASDLPAAFTAIGGMFGGQGIAACGTETLYYLRSYAVVLVVAAIGATPLLTSAVKRISAKSSGERIMNIVEPVALLGLMAICTAMLVNGSFNPFIYFRF